MELEHDYVSAIQRQVSSQELSQQILSTALPALKEQLIFPEISYDKVDKIRGMDVIVTTTAKTDDEARELLRLFGFPFPQDADGEAKAA